jgi:hypothetical protein
VLQSDRLNERSCLSVHSTTLETSTWYRPILNAGEEAASIHQAFITRTLQRTELIAHHGSSRT